MGKYGLTSTGKGLLLNRTIMFVLIPRKRFSEARHRYRHVWRSG